MCFSQQQTCFLSHSFSFQRVCSFLFVASPLAVGEVAHGFSAGLLALLSVPDRSSGAFLLMSEPLSGALAALRGFRRRWAEPEPGPDVALVAPSVHSVTPDSRGSFLGQSLILRPPVHGREWAPHRFDGRGPMPVEPGFRAYFGVSPLTAPSFASRFSPLARVEHPLQPPGKVPWRRL